MAHSTWHTAHGTQHHGAAYRFLTRHSSEQQGRAQRVQHSNATSTIYQCQCCMRATCAELKTMFGWPDTGLHHCVCCVPPPASNKNESSWALLLRGRVLQQPCTASHSARRQLQCCRRLLTGNSRPPAENPKPSVPSWNACLKAAACCACCSASSNVLSTELNGLSVRLPLELEPPERLNKLLRQLPFPWGSATASNYLLSM
jgi:hypothetical protein